MKELTDIKISDNFFLWEFIKSDTAKLAGIKSQYIIPINAVRNIVALTSNILQPLRNKIGMIKITSGYRCQLLNHYLNGAKYSQHLTGSAADFMCEDQETAIKLIKQMQFDQLIIYPRFLHVSYDSKRSRKSIFHG